MRYFLIFFGVLFLTAGCTTKPKTGSDTIAAPEKPAFKVYEMSEMATLMEELYQYHQRQKLKLEKGEQPDAFPGNMDAIYTASFTDSTDNDTVFKSWAAIYRQHEKDIFVDSDHAKTHYNDAIRACIACHRQKCTGPIPRIKKLLLIQ